MDIGNLEYIRSLDGLQIIGVFTIIALLAIGSFKIKNIIAFFKGKKLKIGKYNDTEKMMYQGEKALNDCKNMIESVMPEEFNPIQRWVIKLMLWKAFNGACMDHVRTLIMRNGFGTMSEMAFAEYCNVESTPVMKSVSCDLNTEWSGKENWFPMTREAYETHNYDNCAKECRERIIKFFVACREIKQGKL